MKRCASPHCHRVRGAINVLGVCDGCRGVVSYYPDPDAVFDEPYPGAEHDEKES